MRIPSPGSPPRARRALALIAALVGLAAACAPALSATTVPAGAPIELTVYAAASLKGALEEIAPAYALEAPGVTLAVSTGASSTLRTQIEQGAPADVFLSADTQQPAALVERGLAAGDARAFAGNELTIIIPVDAPGIASPVDLARSGVKIVAAGEAVPITKYANQVVANLAELDGYPAGYAEAYAANIVSREDDVKAVVAKVELGEGDAAIVYRTDALAADAIGVIEDPGRRQRRGDLRRRHDQGHHPPRRSASLPRLADRSPGPGRPGVARVLAARLVRLERAVVAGLVVLLVLFLGLPVAVLVARAVAGRALLDALGDPVVLEALALSLGTTAVTVVVTVVLGAPLAYLLARRRFRGSSLVETIVDLPIVLPPSVAGLALLLVFGRRGLIGSSLEVIGITIPFTTIAVVLAQIFVAAPFFVRSARAGFAAVDRDLEDAARVDGAAERQVVRWITVPLAGTALAAGLVMSWARALGEFGATIMFAGNIAGRTQTLPLVVYGEFGAGDLDSSIAAASILVLAAFGVLIAVRLLRWGRALDVRGT